ncbi:ABC transporter permease [Neobacillus mesonae]|uniref:ABC transporter permease n=1 Tax=Neobacillus mesonae TaxID=1193713 RepID=UPI00203F4CBA|nr:ABC transporter permease [Neobacillus mesonae]MCM3569940.1 ABC transporter permease [Neobacillus mesonae]
MRKNIGLKSFAWLVFAFLLIPLLIIVITSFGTNSTIQFPIKGFTFNWYGKVFQNESFMDSFVLSLEVAFIGTLAALIIGVPAAYSLARHKVFGRNWIKSFFLSPTIVPGLVVGYAVYQFVVIQFQFPILQGLMLGHFLICLPYVIRVVGSTIEQLDFSIEEVSWTLGCTKLQTFFKIVIPNITSGIFASFMLAFINSFNNIPVSQFLSGPGVTMLPTSLMNYIEYNYDPSVSALSVVLMLGTIVLMFIIEKTLGLASIS